MIALVDYGAGNLTSVRKALSHLGANFTTVTSSSQFGGARGIIVPGVGHFDATSAIDNTWRAAIRQAIDGGTSLLGICLGLQWLFEGSEEAPALRGLGCFAGSCVHLGGASAQKLKLDPTPFKVPHVGWNGLSFPRPSRLMAGIEAGAQVYFTHSYAAPVIAATAAVTEYGMPFSAAVELDNVAAVQFHPEKSGDVGLRILRNWLDAV